jgi:hypothetical protein
LVNFYQTTRCYNPEDSNLHVVKKLYYENEHTAQLKIGFQDLGGNFLPNPLFVTDILVDVLPILIIIFIIPDNISGRSAIVLRLSMGR